MSLAHNPRIVTDGLVLCLDAANPKSYPGSETTWGDLSGNGNNGTLIGSVFNSSNGGNFIFDGTDDGIQLPHNSTWVLTPSDSFSICGWVYPETTTRTGSMIFSHQKCNNPTIQIIANDTTSISFRIGGNSNSYATYIGNITGKWNYIVATFDGTHGNMNLYLNGNLSASSVNSGGWSSYTAGYSEVWLGRRFLCGNTGEMNGKISTFSFYKGKVLSASEIKQNFNALKGRYGL